MSAAHTPGPWLAHNTGERIFTIKATLVSINASASEKERDYYQGIASVSERGQHPQHGGGIDFKTCKANANLMAAAPDLLASLKIAFEESEKAISLLAMPMFSMEWHEAARAAIAKAGGAA